MKLSCWLCALVALMLSWSLLAPSRPTDAADKPAPASKAKPAQRATGSAAKSAPAADDEAQDADQGEEEEDEGDLYAIPSGDSAKLLKYIEKVSKYRPKDARDARNHRERAMAAIQGAAKKIIEVEADKSSEAYQIANRILFSLRVQTIGDAPPAEQRAFVKELFDNLDGKSELGREDFATAFGVAQALEYSGADSAKLAADVYDRVSKLFQGHSDEQVAAAAGKAEGAARRLRLVGNTMEIQGTPVDGSKFDWAKYRGKVVLVDFWATWCGPCVQEVPNVLKQYERYHDRGFDVVGISLDDNKEALQEFLETREIPWLTLNDGGQSKVAEYYGIMGIPTVILVDKQGKVVSLNARGPELGRLLATLLGPVADTESDDAESES